MTPGPRPAELSGLIAISVPSPINPSPSFPPAQTSPGLLICSGEGGADLYFLSSLFFLDSGSSRTQAGKNVGSSVPYAVPLQDLSLWNALLSRGGWLTASLSLSFMNTPVQCPLSWPCALTPPVSMWSPSPTEAFRSGPSTKAQGCPRRVWLAVRHGVSLGSMLPPLA